MKPLLHARVITVGTVVPVLVNPDGTLVASSGDTGTLSGAGSPQGSVSGTAGQIYVRTSDNTFWVSTGGTNWTLAGGGSGAGLYSGVGSPEGVVTAVVGSIYTDTATSNLYTKVSGAGPNGWGP